MNIRTADHCTHLYCWQDEDGRWQYPRRSKAQALIRSPGRVGPKWQRINVAVDSYTYGSTFQTRCDQRKERSIGLRRWPTKTMFSTSILKPENNQGMAKYIRRGRSVLLHGGHDDYYHATVKQSGYFSWRQETRKNMMNCQKTSGTFWAWTDMEATLPCWHEVLRSCEWVVRWVCTEYLTWLLVRCRVMNSRCCFQLTRSMSEPCDRDWRILVFTWVWKGESWGDGLAGHTYTSKYFAKLRPDLEHSVVKAKGFIVALLIDDFSQLIVSSLKSGFRQNFQMEARRHRQTRRKSAQILPMNS